MRFLQVVMVLTLLSGLETIGFSQTSSSLKRLLIDPPVDIAYLTNDFFVRYQGSASKLDLTNAVSRFRSHLEEMSTFMRDVEKGKIPVTTNRLQAGAQQSYQKKDGGWIVASYDPSTGILLDFQKHQNQKPFPLIYGFNFSTNGFLKWATSTEDYFKFDSNGKVSNYSHPQ